MHIVCTQENIARALSFLERASGKQSTLPILSNFLLRNENGNLKLSATNLEIGVTAYVGAKIEGSGEIAVPVKIVSNFIHNLPAGDVVSMDIDGNAVALESGGYNMKIKGLDPKDFPIIPEKQGEYMLSLPAQELKSALQELLPCVSVNESRIELTGVNFLFMENEIHMAATDSFRLAEYILPVPKKDVSAEYAGFSEQNQSFIIPQMPLQEITRIISPETESVKISFEENQVFFEIDGISIVSRVINGKYPDYKQILPKTYSYEATVSREEFLRAVRMAGVFTSQVNGEMSVSIVPGKGEIRIASKSADVGENETVLNCDVSGGDLLEIIFNPRYILDGLNVLDTEKVTFFANSNSTPVALKGCSSEKSAEKKDNFLYIAMPVRK